jgi:hypothetical protein
MGSTCIHGAYQVKSGGIIREECRSLSKTTKLLLLDSLLQEVCIESDSDGSLTQSLLRLSVRLVSHNLLYSGLKKAHWKTAINFNQSNRTSQSEEDNARLDKIFLIKFHQFLLQMVKILYSQQPILYCWALFSDYTWWLQILGSSPRRALDK